MDGTLITWLAEHDVVAVLNLLGIVWIAARQHLHEKHCRVRHKEHYGQADDLRQRVARLET